MAFEKVLLYITDELAYAYEWDEGNVVSENSFNRDGMGIVQFGKYLSERKENIFTILLNSVDEEYKLVTMPHVIKRRKLLLQRNIDRNYRQHVYKYGVVQGRESFGKKEDQVLLSAVANDTILNTWMQPVVERKISISGICSMPLVTEKVVEKLSIKSKMLLVVTRDTQGLRLTYLNEGKFKISRLVKTEKIDLDEVKQEIDDEIEKTLLYLGRMRLVYSDQKPDILFIGSKKLCQLMSDGLENSGTKTAEWMVFDSDVIATKMGLPNASIRDESATIDMFIRLILCNKPINHYANSEHARYYNTRRMRRPLELASATLLVLLSLAAGMMFIDSQVLEVQSEEASRNVKVLEAKYLASKAKLPDYPVPADAVSAGVKTIELLLNERPDLRKPLVVLSQTISNFENIQLDFLQWSLEKREVVGAVVEDQVQPEVVSDDPTEMGDVDVDAEGVKHWVEVITLNGKLKKFNGNYTSANNMIDKLVGVLNDKPAFQSVLATQKPVNQKPEKRISGRAGKQTGIEEFAEFSLEIITHAAKHS